MGIYIKGMEMPKDCDNCPFFDDRFDYPTCNATGHSRGYNWNPRGQRMTDCPLIEVPPHGDLIDRDALLNGEGRYFISVCREGIDVAEIQKAPTVIPADKDGET